MARRIRAGTPGAAVSAAKNVADLQFLVDFAQAGPETSARLLMSTRKRLIKLTARWSPPGSSGWMVQPSEYETVQHPTEGSKVESTLDGLLRKTQPRLQALLRGIARCDTTHAPSTGSTEHQTDAAAVFQITLRADMVGGSVRIHAIASHFSDRFLFTALRLAEEVGLDRLRVCPASGCGRIFVKVTKKQFCSTNCQMREYMREYRDNDHMPPPKRGDPKGASRGKQTRARGR
jgi:hypothetical protein